MANRRQLKKEIKQAVIILADECLIHYHFIKTIDEAAFDSLMEKIVGINSEFIRRINCPEGTKNRERTRRYYKALTEDFNKAVGGIMEELAASCKKD